MRQDSAPRRKRPAASTAAARRGGRVTSRQDGKAGVSSAYNGENLSDGVSKEYGSVDGLGLLPDDDMCLAAPGGNAYEKLLQSFRGSNSKLTRIYEQRHREEQGVDEIDSDGNEVDGAVDEDGSVESSDGGSIRDDGREEACCRDQEGEKRSESALREREGEKGGIEQAEAERDTGVDSIEVEMQRLRQSRKRKRGGQEVDEDQDGQAEAAADAADHWQQHFGHDIGGEAPQGTGPGRKFMEAPGQEGGGGTAPSPQHKAWPRGRWLSVNGAALPSVSRRLSDYAVKAQVRRRWAELHRPAQQQDGHAASDQEAADAQFGGQQDAAMFSLLNRYLDVLFPIYSSYPQLDAAGAPGPADPVLDAVLLHIVNHCKKAADRIKANNKLLQAAKLTGKRREERATAGKRKQGKAKELLQEDARQQEGVEAAERLEEEQQEVEEADVRDQGFVRAKVLILAPMRNAALAAALRLVALAQRENRTDSIQHKARLVREYGRDPEEETAQKLLAQAAAKKRRPAAAVQKPEDHRRVFDGNVDDHFMLGIKLTKGAVGLFSDLLSADIILASPIALVTHLADAESEGADVLSSIEISVVLRADVIAQQNWQHLEAVYDALNQLPSQQHGVDIMRVRGWALAGRAAQYRQNILLSSWVNADMLALFHQGCCSHSGAVKYLPEHEGVLSQVVPQVQQFFEAFRAASPEDVADARFEAFKQRCWPRMKEQGSSSGLLLVVPHYFQFVRLRNFLRAEDASFALYSEYTKPPDVTRNRSRFFHGQRSMLLYSERAHFYFRNRIRGIKDVFFYGLPQHGHFYSEIVNLLEGGSGGTDAQHATVTVLYCQFDRLELERVVGTKRAKKMLASKKPAFMFL